jgi:hypothetical protein
MPCQMTMPARLTTRASCGPGSPLGIIFDPLESAWVAVRGKRTLVAASSPEKPAEQVEAAAWGEAGPDEGDKTRTWRVLRQQGRG